MKLQEVILKEEVKATSGRSLQDKRIKTISEMSGLIKGLQKEVDVFITAAF